MLSSCACEGPGVVAAIREDVDRHMFEAERDGCTGLLAVLRVFLLSPGLWALIAYRLTHQAITRVRPAGLGAALGRILQLGQQLMVAVTQIDIDPRAHIGPGLMIPHSGYIVIGPARLGRHCNVFQGVTLGSATTEEDLSQLSTPVVEDRVWIGPGAVLAGGLRIGADASVGANSVVTRDVPACGVVLGVPARLVSRAGSFKQITYRGRDDDPEREASGRQVVITLPDAATVPVTDR